MLRNFTGFFAVILLACGIAGCASDSVKEAATMSAGTLTADIISDATVRLASEPDGTLATGYEPAPGSVSLSMSSSRGDYSHTWEDASKFQQGQYYIAGLYTLRAHSGTPLHEGFDLPAFEGAVDADVTEGSDNRVTLTLKLANALARVHYAHAVATGLTSAVMRLHTPGGLYHTYAADESRSLCLNPGRMELLLTVVLADGRKVSFPACEPIATRAATLYDITVDCAVSDGVPSVSVITPAGTTVTTLTDEFVDAAAPLVTTSWPAGAELQLPEGDMPPQRYVATISSATRLSSVVLSTLSLSLSGQGFPDEVDLLAPAPDTAERLRALGLSWSLDATGGEVDLSALLGNLVYLNDESALSSFALVATAADGKMSQPVSLLVNTSPVEIEVIKTYPVTMGIDKAHIEVRCDAPGFMNHVEIEVCDESGDWSKAEPLTITRIDDATYSLAFEVGEGSRPVDVRILYCEEVRSEFKLARVMPPFTIEVDPYATMAAVRIVTSDASLLQSITSAVRIYINGNESPIYLDLPERGILTVIGLSPNTTYEFKATLMSGVDNPDFTPSVTVVTEGTPQLPNADFEERTDGIKYKNLPSGGRYSQTVVEIFNWQHFTSIEQEIPKQWANTNAKTFATASDVHNTWYMQPSVALTRDPVFSQSFAVELTSVGFDPHGKPIPDYTQTGTPYLDYSPIVPDIAYKAAGKLFLGSYSFDPATMQESYAQGIEWHSRPTSLNGYYRYYPMENDRSDCGLATVEVTGVENGREIVIASGTCRLTLALSYTAFSIPLTYSHFGVKATGIRVMFSSSSYTGTIEEESRRISTNANPLTASSTGGRLWIDNVTLAY